MLRRNFAAIIWGLICKELDQMAFFVLKVVDPWSHSSDPVRKEKKVVCKLVVIV